MRVFSILFGLLVVTFCGTSLSSAIESTPLASPQNPVVLTVQGSIDLTNADKAARFDMAMLEKLPTYSFTTNTPWYDQPVKFEGVLLRDLLKRIGGKGEKVTAVALNDYSVAIPVSDIDSYDVILAYKRDGDYMPISDKGPLFIVYPFDSQSVLQAQKFYARSVWQLNRLSIK